MGKTRNKCLFNTELKTKYPFIWKEVSDSDLICGTCDSKFSIASEGKHSIEKHLRSEKHKKAAILLDSPTNIKLHSFDYSDVANNYLSQWTSQFDTFTAFLWVNLRSELVWTSIQKAMNVLAEIDHSLDLDAISPKIFDQFGLIRKYCTSEKLDEWKNTDISTMGRNLQTFRAKSDTLFGIFSVDRVHLMRTWHKRTCRASVLDR